MPALLMMILLAIAPAHAEPRDWQAAQKRSNVVGWIGVGATAAATLSGAAMVTTIGKDKDVGPGWYLPTLALGLAGPPMAAGGSLRARRAVVKQGGTPLSAALGIGSWVSLGVMTGSVLVAARVDFYAGFYALAVAGPIGGVLIGTLASAQLIRNERVGRSLSTARVFPLVSRDRVGLGVGFSF